MSVAMRTKGALRQPAMVTLEQRAVDELRIDLAGLRADTIAVCDFIEPRLTWMHPVSVELGPQVEQVVAGCLFQIARLRKRATA